MVTMQRLIATGLRNMAKATTMTAMTKVGGSGAAVLVYVIVLGLTACGQREDMEAKQSRAATYEEAKREARQGGILHSSNQLGNSAVHTFTAPFFDKQLGEVVYRHCVLVEGQHNDQLDCGDPM